MGEGDEETLNKKPKGLANWWVKAHVGKGENRGLHRVEEIQAMKIHRPVRKAGKLNQISFSRSDSRDVWELPSGRGEQTGNDGRGTAPPW